MPGGKTLSHTLVYSEKCTPMCDEDGFVRIVFTTQLLITTFYHQPMVPKGLNIFESGARWLDDSDQPSHRHPRQTSGLKVPEWSE